MKKFVFAAAIVAGSAGFAHAQEADHSQHAAPAPQAAAEKDPNERICRNVESTATRLGSARDCRTRAEWAEASRSSRERSSRSQQRAPNAND